METADGGLWVSTTAGLAFVREGKTTRVRELAAADAALYRAKSRGRDRVEVDR